MKKTLLSLLFAVVFCAMQVNAAISYVLNESFENAETLPAGWTMEYVSQPITLGHDSTECGWFVESGDSLYYPTGCADGSHRVASRNSGADELRYVTRLITPVLNLNGMFQPQLLFSHAEVAYRGASDTLRVYYRTSATDYWHPYSNAVFARNTNWKNEVIGIVSPSSTYQFAFEITENMGRGVVLDNIIVRSTPTCQNVSNIRASQVHAYDALLSWDANGAYNIFQLMLTTAPVTDFDNVDASTVVASYDEIYNPAYLLSNLDPETQYYVYVRSDCDENLTGYTDWISGSFKTLKVAYLPFTETFNSAVAIVGNTNYAKPEGWISGTSLSIDAPYVYRANTASSRQAYSNDSTAYLAFNGTFSATTDPVPTDQYAYIATPELVCSSVQNLQVDFWATAYNKISSGISQYAAQLYVGVMTDPTDLSTLEIVDSVKVETAYQFKHFYVSLSNYTGTGKFVALLSNSALQNAMYVDNFHIEAPDVMTPNHVACKNVNAKGFTVSADIYDATSWDVVVSSEYKRDGNVSASSILYTQNNIAGTQHVVDLPSLAGQTVCVYVRSHKNGQTSAWSFPVTLRVPTAMTAYPNTTSFEVATGQVYVSRLNNEIRTSLTSQAAASVFFPVTSIEQTNNNYPRLLSTAPNYNGAHVQLTGIDNWFVLPEADTITTLQAVFRYATTSGNFGKIEVGVMSDPYDLSTFTHMATFSASEAIYRRCIVAFDGYQGTGKYIAFRSLNAGSGTAASVNLIDEIVVSKLGTCREASNIEVTAHSSSASITWNGSNMDGWIVGLSQNRSMMNASYTTVNTPSVVLEDLEGQKTYYFTISTICGQDTLMAEDVHSFMTPLGLPFTENFESSSIPAGWTRSNALASNVFNGADLTATTSGWACTSSSSFVMRPQNGYAAYVNVYGSTCHYWLISPALFVDVEEGGALELNFDLGVHGYNGSASAGTDDIFMVAVSVDGGNSWSRQNATVWNNKSDGDFSLNDLNWEAAQSISIDFSRFAGKNIQFAFYGESTISGNGDNYFSVDNVLLHVADPSCGGISGLQATATSGTDASIHWLLGGVNPYPAIIQVSKNSAFTQIIYRDTIQGNGVTLNNLESSSHYYVRVRQNCPNDADWSLTDFRTACDAVTVDDFGTETFDNVASADCWTTGFIYSNGAGTSPRQTTANNFGGVLQITKSATDSTASDGAYAMTPEFDVEDISLYQVVFDAATYSTAAENVGRIAVCIVSDPADAGATYVKMAEINLQTATDSLDMKTYVVSFEDYEGDMFGDYGKYVMFLSEAGADSVNYVYVDNVTIEPAQGCHQVLDLQAVDIHVDGARLHWSGNGTQYEIAVLDHNAKMDTVVAADMLVHTTLADTAYTVTGLTGSSTYYAFIRAICAEGDTSRWSSATRFKTSLGLPFYENFTSATLDPAVWSRYSALFTADSLKGANMSTSTSWTITSELSSKGITGLQGYAARQNLYGTSCNYWLVSPELDLTNVSDVDMTLSFYAALAPYSTGSGVAGSDDRFGVIVSTDNGATWKQSDATWFNISTLGKAAVNYTCNMNKYAGKKIRFAFYDESTVSNADNYIYVDSISLTGIAAVCLGVQNLTAAATSDTEAKASWYIYGTPDSVLVELAQDAMFQNVIDSIYTSADSAVFTNLALNNTYYVRVSQVDCSAPAATTSFKSQIALPYQESFAAANLPSDWTLLTGSVTAAFADSLPTAALTNLGWKISGEGKGLTGNHLFGELYSSSAYTRQWIVSPEILLNAASDANVALIFDLALTNHGQTTAATNTANQEFRVLVSDDGGKSWYSYYSWLFKDNDPEAYMALSSIAADGQRITLPLNNFIGDKIRIAFYKASTGAADNDLHIANLQVREVGEACDAPDSLRTSAVSFQYADIAWNGNPNKMTLIEYSFDATFSGSHVDTVESGLTHRLSGLLPAKTYYVRAWQICGANSISEYSNVLTFNTSIGLPYEEAFAATTLPADWTRYSGTIASAIAGNPLTLVTSATSGWRTSNLATVLGGNHIVCPRTTAAQWIISPEIDLTPNAGAEAIVCTFNAALSRTPTNASAPSLNATQLPQQHFHVLVSLDNGQSWSWANEWLWSQADSADFSFSDIATGAGKEYQLDFTRFGGEKIRVALVLGEASAGTVCVNINNFKIDALTSTCFGVNNMIVNSVDTAAQVTLVAADNATRWQVAYGRAGQDVTAMQPFETQSLNVTLHDLRLSSTYDVYARSICAVGDTSAWSGPFQLTTPQGVPYEAPLATTTFDGWARYKGDVDGVFAGTDSLVTVAAGWTNSTSTIQLGGAHVYCASNTSNTDYWLVSPQINLQPQDGSKQIYLSFNMALTNSSSVATAPFNAEGHEFYVLVSANNGQTWSPNAAIVWGDSTKNYLFSAIPAGAGQAYHLDLSAFAGQKIRIAFVRPAVAAGASAIHINNVSLEEFDVPCFAVSAFKAEMKGGVPTCTVVPADPSQTTFQYVAVARNASPNSVPAVTVTTTTFQITNLAMSTNYDIYVRALCGTSDTSAWFGPAQVSTPLGIRFADNMNWGSTWDSDWSRWTASSASTSLENMTSGASGWLAGAAGRGFAESHVYVNTFGVYQRLMATPEISLANIGGNSIQLSFDLALTVYNYSSAPSATNGQSFQVVVSTDGGQSWQQSADWRWAASDAAYSYSSIPTSGQNYQLDLTEFAGESIMIGFHTKSTISGGPDNDIHIRNIVLDTLAGSICAPIRRISLVDSTYNSATVAFRGAGVDNALQIQYVCVPQYSLFNPSLAQSTDTSVVIFTGLQSSMAYDIYARSMCPDSVWNDWAGPFTFHTVECSSISGISPTNVTLSGANIKLLTSDASAALGYDFFVTEHDGVLDPSQAQHSATNNITFAYNFNASQVYDLYARKICNAVDTSDWAGPFTFNSPRGVRYEESFEWTSWNSDWKRYENLNATSTTSSGWTYGRSGNGFDNVHLYVNTYSTYERLVVSPEIDLANISATSPLDLSFELALTTYNGASAPSSTNGQSFYVLINTGNGWQTKNGFSWGTGTGFNYDYASISSDGEQVVLDMSRYAGQKIQIGFYTKSTVSGGPDNDIHIRNLVLDTIAGGSSSTCKGIEAVTVANVSLNQATVTVQYKESDSRQVAYYEVSTDAAFSAIVAEDTIYGTSAQLKNLQPSTTYYIHVRQVCSDEDESAWSRSVTFNTAYGVRYVENFNNATSYPDWQHSSTAVRTVWRTGKMTTVTSGSYWSRFVPTSSTAWQGFTDGYIRQNIYSTRCSWLISPTIDLRPNGGQALLFAIDVAQCAYSGGGQASYSEDDKFVIAVSEDAGATWSRTNATVWCNDTTEAPDYPYSNIGLTPTHIVLDFSKYAGKQIKVAICGESTVSGTDNYLMFDNIDLNVSNSYSYSDVICEGEDYENYGFNFSGDALLPGTHEYSYISAALDSVVHLNLTVKPAPVVQFTDTICEGEVYNEHGFNFVATHSGTYRQNLRSANGCDSTILLSLSVSPIQRKDVNLYACKGMSFTIAGRTYYSNNIARDTLISSLGCDSVVTYYMYFSAEAGYEEHNHTAICAGDSVVVGEFVHKAAGTYRDVLTAIGGCDSVITTVILPVDFSGIVYDTIYTSELPYVFNEIQLLDAKAQAQDYKFSVTSTCGAAELHLTVLEGTGWEEILGNDKRGAQKVVRDNHIYLILDDRWYDATGKLVESLDQPATRKE